jgi:hypothetical protein
MASGLSYIQGHYHINDLCQPEAVAVGDMSCVPWWLTGSLNLKAIYSTVFHLKCSVSADKWVSEKSGFFILIISTDTVSNKK